MEVGIEHLRIPGAMPSSSVLVSQRMPTSPDSWLLQGHSPSQFNHLHMARHVFH
jgi:hypothetical protein